MLQKLVLIGLACLLSGCGREPDPEQKASSDARDIAMVEAAQTQLPPLVTVQLRSIATTDRKNIKAAGPHCEFMPEGVGATGPTFISNSSRAYVKIDEELIALASDPSGPAMPMATWARYGGKRFELEIKLPPGSSGPGSSGNVDKLSSSLVLRDAYQREISVSAGELVCSK